MDPDQVSQARVYDYLLGGRNNFAVDQAAAEAIIALNPDAPLVARANRAFLRRAVRYLVGRGSGSSLTSAPGCRRRTTFTRSRSNARRMPASSTFDLDAGLAQRQQGRLLPARLDVEGVAGAVGYRLRRPVPATCSAVSSMMVPTSSIGPAQTGHRRQPSGSDTTHLPCAGGGQMGCTRPPPSRCTAASINAAAGCRRWLPGRAYRRAIRASSTC